MRVLLIQPPHYYGSNSRPPSAFPLGLAYIAAVLSKKGHKAEVFDIYAEQLSAAAVQDKIDKLDSQIDVLCLSALSNQYRYIKWLIPKLKEKFAQPLVVGNALATFSAEALLKHSAADVCVIGEGEEAVIDLLDNLHNLHQVKGIAYRQNGQIYFNPPRDYIKDLNTIDFPKRDIFPAETYLKHSCLWSDAEIRAIDIITARGCPYHCNFCSKTFQGIRLRSIDNIIQEIEQLRAKYDFKGVNFHDELTLINKPRAYELCKYLKEAKLSWVCQGRVNIVDQDLLRCMKDAGCRALGFGVESGSQKILDNMNKGISIEQAVNAIRATKKAGIEPIIQMMHGYPGEDEETLQETRGFFRRVKSPTMQFSLTTPLPGTQLYRMAKEKGLIEDEDKYLEKLDWGYYGEREVLINFTAFSDAQLISKRRQIERQINRAYKKYLFFRPWIIFRIIFHKIRSYYLRYGLTQTFKKLLKPRSHFKDDHWLL